jgi:hypothetical protein
VLEEVFVVLVLQVAFLVVAVEEAGAVVPMSLFVAL